MGYTANLCTGGTAYAESELNASYAPSYAFDGTYGTDAGWSSTSAASGTNSWIAYKFSVAKTICRVRIYPREAYPQLSPKNFEILGSNNSTNGIDGSWTSLATGLNTAAVSQWNIFDFSNTIAYIWIKISGNRQLFSTDAQYYLQSGEIEMMEYTPDVGKIFYNINGTLRQAQPKIGFVNIDGTLRQITKVFVNVEGVLKLVAVAHCWSAGGNLATKRYKLAGAGTQTAGLSFGGSTGSYSAITEEYDGAAWSAGGNLNTARRDLAGAGTQTAGLSFGGYIGSYSAITEEYDGAAWAAGGNLATARYELAGAGTQTAGLSFGGSNVGALAVTEEYTIY